jgi:hypothetical protein
MPVLEQGSERRTHRDQEPQTLYFLAPADTGQYQTSRRDSVYAGCCVNCCADGALLLQSCNNTRQRCCNSVQWSGRVAGVVAGLRAGAPTLRARLFKALER